eukprot:s255_g7.t1
MKNRRHGLLIGSGAQHSVVKAERRDFKCLKTCKSQVRPSPSALCHACPCEHQCNECIIMCIIMSCFHSLYLFITFILIHPPAAEQ